MIQNLLFMGKLTNNFLLICFYTKQCLIVIKDSKSMIVASDLKDNNSKLYYLLLTNSLNVNSYDLFLTKQIDQV